MSTITLNANEAIELCRKEGITLAQLEEMGFAITTAGQANVVAAAVAPTEKPELVAAATLLQAAAVKRGKTANGRQKYTLGAKEGTGIFNVVVTVKPADLKALNA